MEGQDALEFVSQLKPKDEEERIRKEKLACGGLRRASRALKKLPEAQPAGQKVGEALDGYLDASPGIEDRRIKRLRWRPKNYHS